MMKKNLWMMLALMSVAAGLQAQEELPFFLPGDGVYIVGMDVMTGQNALTSPTLVSEAYQMTLRTQNVDVAAVKAGSKNYNLSQYLTEDNLLDIRPFMGVGSANGLIVRNFDGDSYQLGDYAPEKTWTTTYLLSAAALGESYTSLPLAVYDAWDCPITYEADPVIAAGADTLTVDFGNPQEGLVVQSVSMNLLSESANEEALLRHVRVCVRIYNKENTTVERTLDLVPESPCLTSLSAGRWAMVLPVEAVICTRFEVEVSGLHAAEAWLPRAVDSHSLYPTHTTYSGTSQSANTDACIQVNGYFNYVGTWGMMGGKQERGEAFFTGDLVQIYYDPSDPDWPGDFYQGEATFPVECTFGAEDIVLKSAPSWIIDYMVDASQWAEYGAVQLAMQADALPEEKEGRLGKVVWSTADGASEYTILVRQGIAWFDDDPEQAVDAVVDIDTSGGLYDLLGRPVTTPAPGNVYIRQGKKWLYSNVK